MSFADNIQYLRKKNKITQEELAEELNVSRQSVSKWETGEAYPETEKLIILCDKFGVTMDELLRGDVTAAKDSGEGARNGAPEREEDGGEQDCQCGDNKHFKLNVIGTAVSSSAMIICAIVYLCLGFTLEIWHPTWLVFMGGVLICIWAGAFTDESGKSKKERIVGAVCGSTMVSAVIIFLAIGFTLGIWHPTWVAFLIGAGVVAIVGSFTAKK